MGNETEIFGKLGKIDGTLEEVKGLLMRTEEKNDKEHNELRAEIALRALKIDVDNIGDTMRKHEKRFDALENKSDRDIAKTVKNIGRYVAIFIGSALFLFIITNLHNFITFIQEFANKK